MTEHDPTTSDVSEEQASFLDIIAESAERMLQTSSALLEFARLDSGDVRLRLQEVELVALAREVVERHHARARKAGLALAVVGGVAAFLLSGRVEDDDDTDGAGTRLSRTFGRFPFLFVLGVLGTEYLAAFAIGRRVMLAAVDPAALAQILEHLLDNALKFTCEGGVTVHLEARPEEACLRVVDTGCGIDPAFQPYVFEMFRQESEGLSRTYQGNGLGLTIVRRLVEELRGTIHVESEKGKGAAFTVRLPRHRRNGRA